MRIVTPVLKKIVYPSFSKLGLFRRGTAPGVAVVTYHGVLPRGYKVIDAALDGNLVSTSALGAQLRFLKRHYCPISPEDFRASLHSGEKLPAHAVLVTCDDGLLNCLTEMLPVLEEERVHCLFFVTGASTAETRRMLWYEDLFLTFLQARAGNFVLSEAGVEIRAKLESPDQRRALWWSCVRTLSGIDSASRDRFVASARCYFGLPSTDSMLQIPGMRDRFSLLTASELRALAAAGMTIGAHTLTHPLLSHVPNGTLETEIAGSRIDLETVLGIPVWALAYPFGDAQSVTPEVLPVAERAGFEAAFLNYGGGLGVPMPKFALPRIHVTANMTLSEFEAHVSGFYAWLQRRAGKSTGAMAS